MVPRVRWAGGGAVVPRVRWAALWLLCAGVLAVTVLAWLVLAAPASQASGTHQPAVVVVQPDDTLWSIASRHLPGRDPYQAVDEIRRLNGLSDHVIHPGQQLLVPAR
ncbi:MAG TPA: LysM peptidoglycan-binding domain-containing protein [Natronosporangium sp.]|nr:LysM peptidoglycan-binding domain-containing protein [Natronosporangium sp.]